MDDDKDIVIALTGSKSEDGKWAGCQVISESTKYLAIYSQVFGPDSREACEEWVKKHCGFPIGDPASDS